MTNSAIAVQATGLSKQYSIGRKEGYLTVRDKLVSWLSQPVENLWQKKGNVKQSVWALEQVSFSVSEGEVVGVIGRNGAGKSTLLKVLAGITVPTLGEVRIRGRTGALLEVGTGFSMELTGRENVFLNGSILGMRRKEIRKKFDEIIEFAGVEKFIDTPVKRFSTGMYVRLAFAVAAHLDPDILLVDEVLAVGDADFQKKSLGKMSEVAQAGRTVLFVSHNMAAVEGLCKKAIWLEKGKVKYIGPTRECVRKYLKSSKGEDRLVYSNDNLGGKSAGVKRVNIVVENKHGVMDVGMEVEIEVEFMNSMSTKIGVWIQVIDDQGQLLFTAGTGIGSTKYKPGFGKGTYQVGCVIPKNLLRPGDYGVSVVLMENSKRAVDRIEDAVSFTLVDSIESRGEYYGEIPGIIRPNVIWK